MIRRIGLLTSDGVGVTKSAVGLQARVAAALTLAASCVSGCAAHAPRPSGQLRVMASVQVEKPFNQIGDQFRGHHPGISLRIDYGFTPEFMSALLSQNGSHPDVMAPGDATYMDQLAKAGLLDGPPVTYAAARIGIVVPWGNPKAITSWQDLVRPGLRVAVCARAVTGVDSVEIRLPCGQAVERIEKSTGVRLAPVSAPPRSADVLQQVLNGDVDAGVLYAFDSKGAGVATVPFPEANDVMVTFPIAVLKGAQHPELAHEFVDLVCGSGQSILHADGFDAPSER